MITTIDQFKDEFQAESASTQKIFSALTDESLTYSVAADHRTIGRMAWHIVQTLPDMAKHTGLDIDGPSEESPVPGSAHTIVQTYIKTAKSLLERVTAEWDNDTLQIEDDLYGEMWKRGYSLYGMIKHEIHHRGQLTVLMRLAGLKVPGVYGPAKEEWSQFGMPEPAV